MSIMAMILEDLACLAVLVFAAPGILLAKVVVWATEI